ncbi:ornithine cyclodeaminase family protein [candidate division KSB1 bacterium]|nr:ornithine cyclodeaminase family protein [candidate division KSB1 bacterium]
MTQIFTLNEIKKVLLEIDVTTAIEDGFVAYSNGNVVVPPVGELIFENPPGDVHIKYGYIKGDEYYVIKIASGFPENIKLDLSSSNGLMLVFKQATGELACILQDEGFLTNVRTAVAGKIVAKYLAPKSVHRIGILGTGIQGRMQLEYLKPVIDCRDVIVWGRKQDRLDRYKTDMEPFGFSIQSTQAIEEVTSTCNFIVTTTSAKSPLVQFDQIKPGTHVTAMGSDTPDKIELDPKILQKADLIVADSIPQCRERGEISHALKAGLLDSGNIIELGKIISNPQLGRIDDNQLTIADLTGVAVQDIQISKQVFESLMKSNYSASKTQKL